MESFGVPSPDEMPPSVVLVGTSLLPVALVVVMLLSLLAAVGVVASLATLAVVVMSVGLPTEYTFI